MKQIFCYSFYFFLFFILVSQKNVVNAQTLGSVKEKYEYIGISRSEFNSLASFGKQRNSYWCWAACIQMVLNFHRIPVTQEQVVKKAFGKLSDRPANSKIIFKSLNGWQVDSYGEVVKVNSNSYPTTINEITSFVRTKNPLIVGLKQSGGDIGHAYVLLGIYYQKQNSDMKHIYIPHSVILVDPWPGNNWINDMSWNEFAEKLIVSYKVWVN